MAVDGKRPMPLSSIHRLILATSILRAGEGGWTAVKRMITVLLPRPRGQVIRQGRPGPKFGIVVLGRVISILGEGGVLR
jgi:hypothetical protein